MKKLLLSSLFLFFIGPFVFAQTTETKTAEVKTESEALEMEQLVGNYTSKENPDGILIYANGTNLMGKFPGKPSIALKRVARYSYQTDGIFFAFNPEKKHVILRQNNGESTYQKK